MERYFEGQQPTDEELARLIVRAVAAGQPDSDRLRARARRASACRSCSTRWPCARCRRTRCRERPTNADGAGGRGQGRPGRPAGRPGLQDPHRPVRAEAEFHPRLLGHAQEGHDGAGGRRAQGRQDRANCSRSRPTRPSRSTRPGRATIVAVAKIEDLHTGSTLGELAMPPIAFPDADGRPGRHAQEPQRRDEALRRAGARSRRRTRRSAASAIRRPRRRSSTG